MHSNSYKYKDRKVCSKLTDSLRPCGRTVAPPAERAAILNKSIDLHHVLLHLLHHS
jgi:hypothetical protein